MFEVYFGNKRAKKDYGDLDDAMRSRIDKLCETLSKIPVPFQEYDVIKIAGRNGSYRIRLGRFRVLYFVDELAHKIYVLAIEPRSETTYK